MEIENSRIASLISHNSGQGAPVDNQGGERAKATTNDPAGAGNTGDRLSLTGEARQLKELESRIAAEPAVDSQRVSEVRTAIDNGTFSINAERIAEKLLSLEQALTDAR